MEIGESSISTVKDGDAGVAGEIEATIAEAVVPTT